MKIYAKQVPPEYQESPLFLGDWPKNVFVYGNRHYIERAERLEEIRRGLEDLADAWEDLTSGVPQYYASWIDALRDILPHDGARGGYTRPERLELAKLAAQYEWSDDDDILCRVLELVTGRAWENTTIRGCSQGDWQNVIYPAEYGRDWLEAFEAEYFNTGTEWTVDPDGDACSVYVTGWSDDDARQEIADAFGCRPGDVVLMKFTGWSRSACYEEVTA